MLIVKDVLSRTLVTAGCETTVREACGIMKERRVGSVFIVNKAGEPEGIVTESDMVRKVVGGDRVPYVTRVTEVMSAPIVCIDINENIYQAQELMDQKHILHLAVTDGGKIVGMVSIRDLIHPYEHFEQGTSWV